MDNTRHTLTQRDKQPREKTSPEKFALLYWRQPLLHAGDKLMSETSKRELVVAFAAMVMLILFFGSGTL